MDFWLQQFFLYCERGRDPGFWAEPLNALSNGAFLVAAIAAFAALRRRGTSFERSSAAFGLVLVAAVIGVASFFFHTTAARWAFVFDTGSIAVFSVSYLVYAMRRFAGASWPAVIIAVLGLLAGFPLMRYLPCPGASLMPLTAAAGYPCLNGSLGYVPVIVAMTLIGGALFARQHGAGCYLLCAAGVFAVSLAVRSFDTELCASTVVFGRARGTHALWHVLNAVAIYLLLLAAVRHGRDSKSPA